MIRLHPLARTLITAIALGGALSACGGLSEEEDEEAMRAAATPAVYRIAVREYPLAPTSPLANCVVEQASEAELVILAQAQMQGIRGVDANLVRTIVSRPDTKACLSDAGLGSGNYGW